MYTSKVIKRLLIPGAVVVAEASKNKDKICKRTDLPLYTPEPVVNKAPEVKSETVAAIEDTVKGVRTQVQKVVNECQAYERVAEEYVYKTIDNADWMIQYLREEENYLPKYGAISIGGLTGLIFGLRGGFIKRTLYMATGALGMAAVCYPNEASEYSKLGVEEGKKYATIAYNFVYGVKKGDEPLQLPSFALPASVSEAWDKLSSTVISDDNAENKKVTEKSCKKKETLHPDDSKCKCKMNEENVNELDFLEIDETK